MPRKQAATPREPTEAANPDDAQRVCYLDEFLESVTETADLPAEVKRNLARLRDLDTQAQEQYERMQKQSKNHIARAKRSVQGGQEPDDELLRKARRTCQELLDIDSEKVEVADKMYDDLTRHLERCESELCKFEEELRERGQLKAPASVKAPEPAAAAADGAAGLSVQLGGGGDMPAPPGTGGRRGRQPSTAGLPEASPTSHKRGRGRKVSHKEAERQRQAAELAAAASAAGGGGAGFGAASPGGGELGGAFGGTPARQEFTDAALPIASREDSNRPLCGAMQAPPTYIVPERHRVAAQVSKQDWILASVLKFNTVNNKYIVLDADDGEEPDPAQLAAGGSLKQHHVPTKSVIPLPLWAPLMYNAHNELRPGQMALALYPDTTCFYKAIVHTPPSARRHHDYLVEFEDESEPTGRGEPTAVPQKYVLRIPDWAR